MSERTRELGKQAMAALEKAVLSALKDAEAGECSNKPSSSCNGNDEHGPACIISITGIYAGHSLRNGIVDVTLQYLQSKGFVDKPNGYRLTDLGKEQT